METYKIYHVKNTINGKGYVGFTKRTVEQRWKSHLSASRIGSPYRFHSALRKYGPDPWMIETLLVTDSIDDARRNEQYYIEKFGYQNKRIGYNAKPGGCGGWIVAPQNYEAWLAKMGRPGPKNGRYNGVTNEDLIDLLCELSTNLGCVPGLKRLVQYGYERGVCVPKHFTKFRFEGSYANLVKIVEERTGLKYNAHCFTEAGKKRHAEAASASTKERWRKYRDAKEALAR